MINDNSTPEDREIPILTLIQKIKDGLIDPRTLDKESRQRCVEVLIGEGLNEPATAQILNRSEKTIGRDLDSIREKNSLSPDINLAKQLIGEMLQKARMHQGQLMRLARSKEASIAEKTQAELGAWHVYKEMVEKMQTLGYLPLKPQEIVGDIFHYVEDADNEKSIVEVKSVLAEIEAATKIAGTLDAETETKINALKSKIEKAEINNSLTSLVKEADKLKDEREAQNED